MIKSDRNIWPIDCGEAGSVCGKEKQEKIFTTTRKRRRGTTSEEKNLTKKENISVELSPLMRYQQAL